MYKVKCIIGVTYPTEEGNKHKLIEAYFTLPLVPNVGDIFWVKWENSRSLKLRLNSKEIISKLNSFGNWETGYLMEARGLEETIYTDEQEQPVTTK